MDVLFPWVEIFKYNGKNVTAQPSPSHAKPQSSWIDTNFDMESSLYSLTTKYSTTILHLIYQSQSYQVKINKSRNS